jgi:hypothetical protein
MICCNINNVHHHNEIDDNDNDDDINSNLIYLHENVITQKPDTESARVKERNRRNKT